MRFAIERDFFRAVAGHVHSHPTRVAGLDGLRGLSALYVVVFVVVVTRLVAQPLVHDPVAAFGVTLALRLPRSLTAARLFAAVFERPFQRHRSWADLRRTLASAPSG